MIKIYQRLTQMIILTLMVQLSAVAQIVNVGSGSYTTAFPGTDAAGRNGYPSGTPFVVGNAANRPVPTNDWWSDKVKNAHSSNLFNYPFTEKTLNSGLVLTYIPWGPIDNIEPVKVGLNGLNASAANISDFSDWTITMQWKNGTKQMEATTGIGMPFVYFTKDSASTVEITADQGTATIHNEILIIENLRNGADFAVYAPSGSVWTQSGNVYSSSLNGENYWSLAFLPLSSSNLLTAATSFQQYAYVFPTGTTSSFSYDENTSQVTTTFNVQTSVKEGTATNMLLGLLPHQWANLSSGSVNTPHIYNTVRGQLKMMAGNTFSTVNTFYGILPTLPYIDFYSPTFSPAKMNTKIKLLENEGLATWTDSYNEGQAMNRLIQTARVAEISGDTVALNKIVSTIKARLEDWLKANSGEVAFLFYYNQTWSAMLGYPAGHGQDVNINDHHFHWGYFIHAAAFLEQYDAGWKNQWGDMINLLVRDAASSNRQDNLFPYLRNFSPYAGHCWANGFATFPQGNDQESTSESMQFNSSLIHWGEVTGNDSIRDLGIYLYTTEQAAVEEYWFDMYNRNFASSQQYSLVSRVWGNSYDNGTFWTADIAASYGIEMYPIHGGSLYLGHNVSYVDQLWAEIEQNTGILTNDPNVNLWHDVKWKYLSFTDPQKAITMYDSYPERNLKFGISDAQTYHWLHSMNVLGEVSTAITSNHPLAAAFNNNGTIIYVAQNYGNDSIVVNFSDGFNLDVPGHKLVTSIDVDVDGVLSSSFTRAYPGGSVDLDVVTSGTGIVSKVEFYQEDVLIGTSNSAPYMVAADSLQVGVHNFYARVYEGNTNYALTNLVSVQVGEQYAFSGIPTPIPGSFEAGHYDVFEGGNGNGIAYQDLSANNNGGFRPLEDVDAELNQNEGAVVGWISAGEWLEYTVDVQTAGEYKLEMRYACGNSAGGGPLRIESDGDLVFGGIGVNNTNGWNTWATKTLTDIPLKSGEQVMRIHFESGEVNVGKFTWTYEGPLSYDQAVADAGANQILLLPQSTATLDGSASSSPSGGSLNYQWTQIFGPSIVNLVSAQSATSAISGLQEGVYLFELEVTNGSSRDIDQVYVISGNSNNVPPTVSLISPLNGSVYLTGEVLDFNSIANDLNDSVVKVDFYLDGILLGSDNQAPFTMTWNAAQGQKTLHAVAFDSFGDSATSNRVNFTVDPAPPCRNLSSNGDFYYEFSDDDNNPTITFIPTIAGMGSPTCILYIGTDPGALPGYNVTPNQPFRVTASKGTRLYFYYTYTHPSGGERNNAGSKDVYLVGSCQNISLEDPLALNDIQYYPNPVSDFLKLELGEGQQEVSIFNGNGQLLQNLSLDGGYNIIDMRSYQAGFYMVRIRQGAAVRNLRLIVE